MSIFHWYRRLYFQSGVYSPYFTDICPHGLQALITLKLQNKWSKKKKSTEAGTFCSQPIVCPLLKCGPITHCLCGLVGQSNPTPKVLAYRQLIGKKGMVPSHEKKMINWKLVLLYVESFALHCWVTQVLFSHMLTIHCEAKVRHRYRLVVMLKVTCMSDISLIIKFFNFLLRWKCITISNPVCKHLILICVCSYIHFRLPLWSCSGAWQKSLSALSHVFQFFGGVYIYIFIFIIAWLNWYSFISLSLSAELPFLYVSGKKKNLCLPVVCIEFLYPP